MLPERRGTSYKACMEFGQFQQLSAALTPRPGLLFVWVFPGHRFLIGLSENSQGERGELHVFRLLGSSPGDGQWGDRRSIDPVSFCNRFTYPDGKFWPSLRIKLIQFIFSDFVNVNIHKNRQNNWRLSKYLLPDFKRHQFIANLISFLSYFLTLPLPRYPIFLV